MKARLGAVASLVLLVLLLADSAAARAQGGIKLEAQAGLDGVCRTGAWIPVRVRAENDGSPAEVSLQVSFKNNFGADSAYELNPLSLPPASRKEVVFYLPAAPGLGELSVRVLEGGAELARKKLRISCGSGRDLHFGVFSETPQAFNLLAALRSWKGGKTRLAQLSLSDFPDQPQGLSALDALAISNADTGGLSAAQRQALLLWVADGGILFVTGGINWQATTAGLGELLPVQISSLSKTADFSALSDYLRLPPPPEGEMTLAGGKLVEGARVLVAQQDLPLLAEKRIGFGSVYYFAADPALQPLSQWDGMSWLYDYLLSARPRKPAWSDSEWSRYQADEAVAALPELELPSFFYLCCWLAAYIALVGPVNYWVLRRLKRTELAWATIPILVVVFSCSAYVSGSLYRGNRPTLHRLSAAQGWDGVAYAHANDLIGIYSPVRAAYDAQAREGFLFRPLEDSSENWLQSKNQEGVLLRDLRVDIGGMAVLGAEGYMPALQVRHDLTLTLTKNNAPRLEGTITNAGEYVLRSAALIAPDGWEFLGDLAPNASAKVSRPVHGLTEKINLYQFLSDLKLDYYPSTLNEADERRRAAFLRASLSKGGSESSYPGGFYLMAWVDDLPAPVELRGEKSETVDGMLYLLKLEPQAVFGSQTVTLNAGMYEWESSIESLSDSIPQEGYEVRFRPTIPMDIKRASSLKLDLSYHSPSGVIEAYLWNFETRAWDLAPDLRSFAPNPSQYVGADGELRLRFNVSSNDYGEIMAINFDLQASR